MEGPDFAGSFTLSAHPLLERPPLGKPWRLGKYRAANVERVLLTASPLPVRQVGPVEARGGRNLLRGTPSPFHVSSYLNIGVLLWASRPAERDRPFSDPGGSELRLARRASQDVAVRMCGSWLLLNLGQGARGL